MNKWLLLLFFPIWYYIFYFYKLYQLNKLFNYILEDYNNKINPNKDAFETISENNNDSFKSQMKEFDKKIKFFRKYRKKLTRIIKSGNAILSLFKLTDTKIKNEFIIHDFFLSKSNQENMEEYMTKGNEISLYFSFASGEILRRLHPINFLLNLPIEIFKIKEIENNPYGQALAVIIVAYLAEIGIIF